MEKNLKHGTTTVGVVCRDGIVLGADKRVSSGYLVSDKKFTKIKKISDHMALTTAGLVSDAQLFTRIITAQLALLTIRNGKEPTIKEGANLLASLSYQNIRRPSMVPGIVGFLLGGVDKFGNHLYEIGIDGSTIEADDYRTDGSGSYVALGVLESSFKRDMSLTEGIDLVVKALNAAIQRDMATGNGIDILTITKDGVTHVMSKEVEMTIKA
ncbi:proteasome subunit beta [Candidatus Woesearchaeota archaeon]|nr:proteasome subunit beta [Candidatus Woesearchaeota archaeon]